MVERSNSSGAFSQPGIPKRTCSCMSTTPSAPVFGSMETSDDTQSFLPSSAESTEVVRQLDEEFPGGETDQAIIVYQRDGGLTAADLPKACAP